jgi:glycosyltransferase involved in cell wall biosynthesis
MRITLVTTTYPPESGWGGIGTYVYSLARGLQSVGHEVIVICGYSRQPGSYIENGIEVHRVLNERHPAESIDKQVLRCLSPVAESREFDVIEFPEIGAFGLSFQRTHPRFPAIIRLHGDSEHLYQGNLSPLKRQAARILSRAQIRPTWLEILSSDEKESVRRAHAVVSPSKWMLKSCLARGWKFPVGCDVIANPLIPNRHAGAYDQNRYSNCDVLWLGRVEALKGIDLLPAIADHVWNRIPDAKFHVIGQMGQRGESDWGNWLMQRIPPRARHKIKLYGGLPHHQVCRELRRYGIAVFASTCENFPYALLECMAEGIACITASEGGAREIGEHGRSVYQVRREPADVAQAIAFLIQNPKLWGAVGTAARQFAEQHYGHIGIAQRMTTIYERATDLAHGTRLPHETASVDGMYDAAT